MKMPWKKPRKYYYQSLMSSFGYSIWTPLTRIARREQKKASRTRQKKKESRIATQRENQFTEWRCGVCKYIYEDETEVEELWIQCDRCQVWYHTECVNVSSKLPDRFVCPVCHVQRFLILWCLLLQH